MLLFAFLQETSSLALNSSSLRSSNSFSFLLAMSGCENYFFQTPALLHVKENVFFTFEK